MAINPNNSLPNNHGFYVGVSGTGKTSGIKANHHLKKARRVIYWDSQGEYKAKIRCKSFKAFAEQLKKLKGTSKPFKIALEVVPNQENFEKFSACVWDMADGNNPIVVVNEEIGASFKGSGELGEFASKVYYLGRKYGLVVLTGNQRIATAPKTAVSQSGSYYVLRQDLDIDKKRCAELVGMRQQDIGNLKDLTAYKKIASAPAQLIKIPIPKN